MNGQRNSKQRIRSFLLIVWIAVFGALGLTGCSSQPGAAEQKQAFAELAQHVFKEEENSQKIIGEVQQLIDEGKAKRNKILSFLETGSEVAKEAKENVERTAVPAEWADVKQDMIEALNKRVEGYRQLALYYDLQQADYRTKGEALLKESYQLMDRAKKQLDRAAGNGLSQKP